MRLNTFLLAFSIIVVCACGSTPKGQSTSEAAKKVAVPATPSVIVFRPPAPSGKSVEFLSALGGISDEYKTYQVSETHEETQVREMSVYVANDVKGFANTDAPRGIIATGKPLDDQARAQTTTTLLRSIRAYISKRCRFVDEASIKVVVMLSGAANESYIDNNYNTLGIINIKLFLVDTKLKRVIWYTDKAWGTGKSLPQATDFASESIAGRLDELFGLAKGQKKQ
jgi:hypothetical protein